jgi:nicotinamidase-related amidase
MPHPKILDKEKTALVIVDLQEAFRSPINDFAQIASRISIVVRGFQILNLPIIITEQYPKGLGRTAEEILFLMPQEFEFIEKSAFQLMRRKRVYGEAEKILERVKFALRTRSARLRQPNRPTIY